LPSLFYLRSRSWSRERISAAAYIGRDQLPLLTKDDEYER